MGGVVTDSNLDLFSEDHIARMTHHCARATEVEAARIICRKRGVLHEKVLQAFRDRGAMTDEELERLPQFTTFAPSTIRKRRSELADPRMFPIPPVVQVGVRMRPGKCSMTVWDLNAEVPQ